MSLLLALFQNGTCDLVLSAVGEWTEQGWGIGIPVDGKVRFHLGEELLEEFIIDALMDIDPLGTDAHLAGVEE